MGIHVWGSKVFEIKMCASALQSDILANVDPRSQKETYEPNLKGCVSCSFLIAREATGHNSEFLSIRPTHSIEVAPNPYIPVGVPRAPLL